MDLGASTQGKLSGPLVYLDLGTSLGRNKPLSRRFTKGRKGKRRLTIREEEAGCKEGQIDTDRSTMDQDSREGSWHDCSALRGQTAGTVHCAWGG